MSRVKSRYLIFKALLVSSVFGMGVAAAAERGELDAWIAANRLGTVDAYQFFLEEYPDSAFAEYAFTALADALEGFATAAGGPAASESASFGPDDSEAGAGGATDSEASADDSPGAGGGGGLY